MSGASISPIDPVSSFGKTMQKVNTHTGSKFYRATKTIQENVIFNRTVLEFLGADLPTALTELIGRNWKKALEDFFRITLYMGVTFFIPLGLIPVWNKISGKRNDLPECFSQLFEQQFEDLLPEKDTPEGNIAFKQRLIKLEGKDKVEEYLGPDESLHEQKIRDLKKKLIKAKTDVMNMDVTSAGILTYQVPWIQAWFGKKILGVVGFSGESDYLSESERESSTSIFEKTKILRYLLGLLPPIFGGKWYASKVKDIVNSKLEDVKESKFKSFLRKNISQFDYYKKIFSNKLNLFGTFLFGGNSGFLLSARSLNEIIERVLRLLVFYPTGFWGDAKIHSWFAERHDKKHGTALIDSTAPDELGIKKVKTLETLEEELESAKKSGSVEQVEKTLDAIKTVNKLYWGSIAFDAVIMGVGLTAANIAGTKWRVDKGIY